MIKKVALTLFLLLAISACSDDQVDKNNASNTSNLKSATSSSTNVDTNTSTTPDNSNGEEVELTEQDMLAMDLLNDEIFFDECNAYAQEDGVDKSDLDSYLSDCVEQLKLQAGVIIDIPDEEKQTEATPPTTSEVSETQK